MEARPATPIAFSDDALLAEVIADEVRRRRDDAWTLALAAEVERRSSWAEGTSGLASRHGQRRASQLIEQLTRVSAREAAERVRVGTMLAERTSDVGITLPPLYPEVSAAVGAGEVGRESAIAIMRNLDQASRRCAPDDIITAEQLLVEQAKVLPADLVADQARLTRDYLDPDGAAPRDEELRRQRRFSIGRERNGLTAFGGVGDPVSIATLRAALAGAQNDGPRFADPELPVDSRTHEQRNFDAFMNLITAGIRADGAPVSARATVIATITLDDLVTGTGVGRIDGVHETLSATTIQTLACDGGYELLVETQNGEPLNLGRTQRLFTRRQRRALSKRDGGCVWPGCTVRAAACDAHHVDQWDPTGLTNVDNGVLICPCHHHEAHATGAEIRIRDGFPELNTLTGWIPLRGRYATPLPRLRR